MQVALSDLRTAGSEGESAAAEANLINSFATLTTSAQALGSAASQPAVSNTERVADDLHGNGNRSVVQVIGNVNGTPQVVGTIVNYGDLYTFNVFFDTVVLQEEQSDSSFEVMKQHVWSAAGANSLSSGWRVDAFWDDWSAGVGEETRGVLGVHPDRLGSIESSWLREQLAATRVAFYTTTGLRGLHHENEFYFHGIGSVLGTTWVDQSIDHYAIGPQLGLGVVAEHSMFRFEAVALGTVGYGWADFEQRGIFGEEVIPGALNRSATARLAASTHGAGDHAEEEYVAWHGETRLTASCQLTQRLRFDATWRWFITGPAYGAAEAVQWNAPDFGMSPGDNSDFTSSDWFLGLTYTH